MQNNQIFNKFNSIEPLISELCKIILTDKDCFDSDAVKSYIKKLSEDEITFISSVKKNDENVINSILFIIITDYLKSYSVKTSGNKQESPFVFDSAGNYGRFVEYFKRTYQDVIGGKFPFFFICIFAYIQNTSEHFRLFEKFYEIRSSETYKTVVSDAKKEANKAVSDGISDTLHKAIGSIDKSAKEAELRAKEARFQAESAERQAKKAEQQAQDAAKDAVAIAVDNKMTEVSTKVSENSVTILGIFAGIVLTVVAGLFYSSSVLESVNSASFFRLTSVASLVGLVCYHLIALMFRSIEKIKNSQMDVSKLNGIDKIISAFLIAVIVITGILQFVFPIKNEVNNVETSSTSIYAEVDVNTKQDDSSSDSSQADETNSVLESTSSNVENSSSEISTNSN